MQQLDSQCQTIGPSPSWREGNGSFFCAFGATVAALILNMATTIFTFAGPIEDGLAAAQRGDYATAFKVWMPLAERGNPQAQYYVGVLFYSGDGPSRDRSEAARWWIKSAEQGVVLAQTNLGNLYSDLGNHAEAVKWWRKAGEQGNSQAQYNVGVAYENGEGVTKDFEAAVKWFRLSAVQGDAKAQYSLGKRYFSGEGVPRNYSESVLWFRRAADQGFADAQNDLGVMYADGRGVPKDVVLAYMWASLSAAQGNTRSSAFRDIVAKEMKPAQIAEAEKLAREWRRK